MTVVVAAAVAVAVFCVTALSGAPPQTVEREAYLMGTRVRLITWAADRAEGAGRLESALRSLEATEAQLSTWRADSEVSTLNRAPVGLPQTVTPDLCRLLRKVETWHGATGGAFDPAVGSLIQAWGIHESGRMPGPNDLARARQTSGFARLGFDRERCLLTRRAATALDVGAFGKGEALDRARAVLGGAPWMIDLGGQIAVNGALPGLSGWPVGIAHPERRDTAVLDVLLVRGSLSTSAGSERDQRVDGARIGHIIDPRTGYPAAFAGSVSVWHESALAADILSTALYVMGETDGLAWAEARGVAACFVTADRGGALRVRMTAAFRSRVLFSGVTSRLQGS